AGGDVAHTGSWKLGARVVPGHFAQTHAHPELFGRTLLDILWEDHAQDIGKAMARLRRYELSAAAERPFDRLSGGQQARFQILLLELAGCTALLLDEPTDNLDLESAEALQEGLEAFDGTVLAVTHDRWFARSFDRFLVFGSDGVVRETPEPVWDERRAERERSPPGRRDALLGGQPERGAVAVREPPVHGDHPHRPCALDVGRVVVDEEDRVRRHADLRRGRAEELGVRLRDAEVARVERDVEQLLV